MTKIFNVSKEDMRTMALLDKGIIHMRSKNDPKFDVAIDKQKKLKKDYLKQIIKEAA